MPQASKGDGKAVLRENVHQLAVNAPIEAARAGEAGKGFAVVAIEGRNDSGQIATFAQRIESSIDNMTPQNPE